MNFNNWLNYWFNSWLYNQFKHLYTGNYIKEKENPLIEDIPEDFNSYYIEFRNYEDIPEDLNCSHIEFGNSISLIGYYECYNREDRIEFIHRPIQDKTNLFVATSSS
jgi:hypothetical protein